MAPQNSSSTAAGAAIYSVPGLLRYTYDTLVLGITNTYIWRAPTRTVLLPFFTRHTANSTAHLDVGVGTGFYLAQSSLPKDASITLCDLNAKSLAVAKSRIPKGRNVECIEHDVTKPLPTLKRVDSISLMYLLHCMPGPMDRKTVVFEHLKDHLKDDGVLFGSTVLGKGVSHNWAGSVLMRLYNWNGIFGNEDDGAEGFLKALKDNFEDVDAEIVGVVLLFTAKGPKA